MSEEYEGDEEQDEVKGKDGEAVFGLDAEMRLKTLQSKKAKRRLRKKMQKEQEEDDK